jgi:5-methylcytosine-specific restriction endonuclease McrBC regulatory subunit McrC
LDSSVEPRYDGSKVDLVFSTASTVGAVPLLSPTTGRFDYGFIVRPRFQWQGIGVMLSEMGWRVIPSPLPLPLLPQSDRKIPPWVLSTIVLFRIEELLKQLERRFEIVAEERSAPRGSVDWQAYATRSVARANFLRVPCRFPDLRDDRSLKAAIRFTLARHLGSLANQRASGSHVLKLIALCSSLLERVQDVAPRQPTPVELEGWLRRPLGAKSYRDGIQAIEWTAGERGLAGASDLQGLPWAMSMEKFFEAWVETVLSLVARQIGGLVRTGRQHQTVVPLRWDPPFLGSQRSLIPDAMLERDDLTVIVDAKYKEHWEEMQARPWFDLEKELRERHRADLLQVLAYANVATTPRVIVCLAYPCSELTWDSLRRRNALFYRASMGAGTRQIRLLLTAMPMGVPMSEVAEAFAREVSRS